MKKLISVILLAAMLLMIGSTGLCEESTPFTPTLTSCVDNTAEGWMTNGLTRAMVTVLLALDVGLAIDDDSKMVSIGDATYVGRSGNIISVLFHIQDNHGECVFVSYGGANAANYVFLHDVSDSFAPQLMAEVCTDGYYKNDLNDLMVVMEDIGEILGA